MTTNTTNPNVEIVYEAPVEPLKESEFHSNADLVKKLNEVIKKLKSKE